MLNKIMTIAGFVLIVVGILCFISIMSGTDFTIGGSSEVAIPADPVIGVFCLVLGAVLFAVPFALQKLLKRSA